jgi:hypothetical protein
VALLGCGGDPAGAPPDGGVIPPCIGPTVCDGAKLRACNDGERGAQLHDCEELDGACFNGRCMSPECAAAEMDRTSFAGCLFYMAEVDNVASDAALATSFLLSNPGSQSAVAVLQRWSTDGSWMAREEALVPPGKSFRMSRLPEMQIREPGPRLAGALRIWSNQPVTVEQIQSDGTDENAVSSGGTLVLPVQALGTRYRVMTYKQVGNAEIAATVGSAGGAGRVLVVGTLPGTRVTFTPSKAAPSVVTALEPSQGDTFSLGDGDTFLAFTAADQDDLSGSEIISNLPVAVFSGNISTTYGMTAEGVHSPDMAHEQMLPVSAWSKTYVAAALPPKAGVCDTLLGPAGAPPGATVWRLLADEPTRVTFDGPGPDVPFPDGVMVSAGEVLEFIATGDFVVKAPNPVLLTEGMDCEPTLSLAISGEWLLRDVTFAVLPVFDQMIVVVRPPPEPLAPVETVWLDALPIDDSEFSPAGGGYEVARIRLEPPCPPGQGVCTHRLQGRFGVTIRGMDALASYATTLPGWIGCSTSTDPSCGPN